MRMRAGLKCRGIKHREACRQRIENHLREAGDPRVIAADSRWASRVVEMGDPSLAPRAEEGQGGGDGTGTSPDSSGSAGRPATAGGPGGSSLGVDVEAVPGPARETEQPEQETVEGDQDDGMSDAQINEDPMLDALLASMPAPVAEEARGVRNLFIVSGCSPRAAQCKVAELYSPPRVTKVLGEAQGPGGWPRPAFPSLSAGSTFDLQADECGQKYDFLQARGRQRCRDRLRAERPWLVVGGPPCTWWSSLMALNMAKMTEQERARRDVEARALLYFACEVYRFQLESGRRFLHEHPEGRGPGGTRRSWRCSTTRGSARWSGTSADTASGPVRRAAPSSRSSRRRGG